MTLKEFATELPALRDEAKALWLVSNSKVLTEDGTWQNYEEKYYMNKLHELIESDDPVKYLKDNSKGEQ